MAAQTEYYEEEQAQVRGAAEHVSMRAQASIVPPDSISGRALLAVIAQPHLLLADEPTGNVDPSLARRLLRLLIELNKSGTSVVIATHDIALMDLYDAPRLVLHDGHLQVYA